MSNKKQTAVEWLFNDYVHKGVITIEAIYKAKEMEKQQIIDAYGVKINQDIEQGQTVYIRTIGEQYYKETYEASN